MFFRAYNSKHNLNRALINYAWLKETLFVHKLLIISSLCFNYSTNSNSGFVLPETALHSSTSTIIDFRVVLLVSFTGDSSLLLPLSIGLGQRKKTYVAISYPSLFSSVKLNESFPKHPSCSNLFVWNSVRPSNSSQKFICQSKLTLVSLVHHLNFRPIGR